MTLKPDPRWHSLSVTQVLLANKADWMERDPGFPGAVIMYFRTAGSLMRFSWFDYTLMSAAFFRAEVGLEGVLRVFYGVESDTPFRQLLERSVRVVTLSDPVLAAPATNAYYDAGQEGPDFVGAGGATPGPTHVPQAGFSRRLKGKPLPLKAGVF